MLWTPSSSPRVRFSTMAVVLVSLGAAILVGFAILELRRVLIWLLLTAFFAVILNPVVDRLAVHMARWQAVGLLGVGIAGLTLGAIALVLPPLIAQLAALVKALPEFVRVARSSQFGRTIEGHLGVADALGSQLGDILRRAPLIASEILHLARATAVGLAGVLSVFFAMVFMLHAAPTMLDRALQLLPPRAPTLLQRLLPPIARSVRRYAAGMVLISAAAGMVAMMSLLIAGVPYFLPVAFAVAVLGFIPFIGATVSALLLGGLTWATASFSRALVVVLVFLVYNQIENNVWRPLVHRPFREALASRGPGGHALRGTARGSAGTGARRTCGRNRPDCRPRAPRAPRGAAAGVGRAPPPSSSHE
jgi:predicted PurR-regulated permease PerM